MPKKELWILYRSASHAARDNGINCIPYQWQKAIEEGWEIICSDFKKDIDDKYNYHEWYRPLEDGSLECLGLVQHVNLEEFGFDKPTLETLKKEVDLLNNYLNVTTSDTPNVIDLSKQQGVLVYALLLELGFAW